MHRRAPPERDVQTITIKEHYGGANVLAPSKLRMIKVHSDVIHANFEGRYNLIYHTQTQTRLSMTSDNLISIIGSTIIESMLIPQTKRELI